MTPALMRLMDRLMNGEVVMIEYYTPPNKVSTFELTLGGSFGSHPVLSKRYISPRGNRSPWRTVNGTAIEALMDFAEHQVDGETVASEEPTDGRYIEL